MSRAKGHGRVGRPWRRIRMQVLNASRVCWICGHDGSTDVDHVLPLWERPDLAHDLTNLRPAHGAYGCPECHRKCNQEREHGLSPAVNPSRRW